MKKIKNDISGIIEKIKKAGVVSIIGMDKNSGKTTTLNCIIKLLWGDSQIGLTSIGRDGESCDEVLGIKKPRIYVHCGTYFATSKESLLRSDVTKMIEDATNISTPLGNIVIAKALSDGYIEIAGPSRNDQVKEICSKLQKLNCSPVIVDGALSRKTFASPSVTRGTIIATGASLSKDMNETVDRTVNAVKLLSIKEEKNKKIIDIYNKYTPESRIVLFYNDDSIKAVDVKTAIGAEKEIVPYINNNLRYIMIKGIVTDTFIKMIIENMHDIKEISILVEDGTKLFINGSTLSKFKFFHGEFKAVHPLNIIGISINPYSPQGYEYDKDSFLDLLKVRVDYPVFNVMDVMR